MKKQETIKQANALSAESKMDEAEALFDEYLQANPNDVEMWLRLAVLENSPPLCYFPKAIDCLQKVLEIDPNNFEAAMLYAYTNYYHTPEKEFAIENLQILNSLKTDDPEKQSMIEYAKSLLYSRLSSEKYIIEYEQALLKSISLHQKHVRNYWALFNLYRGKKPHKAIEFATTAIKNVQKIYPRKKQKDYDWTNYNEHINEFIKGTHLTTEVFEMLEESLEKCKSYSKVYGS